MSHYIGMYCEHHGDWEMDVDNPCECPTCDALGMTEVQTLLARLAASEARVAELDGALRSVVISANKHAIERGIGPADMAPLDKPLRNRIEAALRGEDVNNG